MSKEKPLLIIMAGGTGGHIMPGLAIAKEMQSRGWEVQWLGNPEHMEGKLVTKHQIPLRPLYFTGVRGKGIKTLLCLPYRLIKGIFQARSQLKSAKPDLVLSMGGYIAVPGGLYAAISGIPLVVHEQNACMGSANRLLSCFARLVLSGFKGVHKKEIFVGNPVRSEIVFHGDILEKYAQRTGPLKIFVVGGSQGAKALNEVVPKALAKIPSQIRPFVYHQAGAGKMSILEDEYIHLRVNAECEEFVEDMAIRYQEVDLVICRAGAMTVYEVAHAGVAALFVPLPTAIDDHQTKNVMALSEQGGAYLLPQLELTAQSLSDLLSKLDRSTLAQMAKKAQDMMKQETCQKVGDLLDQLIKGDE